MPNNSDDAIRRSLSLLGDLAEAIEDRTPAEDLDEDGLDSGIFSTRADDEFRGVVTGMDGELLWESAKVATLGELDSLILEQLAAERAAEETTDDAE